MLISCEPTNEEKAAYLYGEWEWVKAVDDQGNDLMENYVFMNMILNTNDSFVYLIDSTYVRGKFKLDEDYTVMRFNYYEVWEILEITNDKLWIRNIVPTKDEWTLTKKVDY